MLPRKLSIGRDPEAWLQNCSLDANILSASLFFSTNMNSENPSFEPNETNHSGSVERSSEVAKVQDRYLGRAKSEEDFSAAVPEPYPGAKSQTRVAVERLRRLADHAEEIYDFETSLAGKTPEQLEQEVMRLQHDMDQLRRGQRQVQVKAREHQLQQDSLKQRADPEIISNIDKQEMDILNRSSLLLEFQDIVKAQLKR